MSSLTMKNSTTMDTWKIFLITYHLLNSWNSLLTRFFRSLLSLENRLVEGTFYLHMPSVSWIMHTVEYHTQVFSSNKINNTITHEILMDFSTTNTGFYDLVIINKFKKFFPDLNQSGMSTVHSRVVNFWLCYPVHLSLY